VSLPDGKTWREPVEPADGPMSLGWKIFLGIFVAASIGATIWRFWDAIYWGSPPTELSTTIVRQTGVIYYSPLSARRGNYGYTLVASGGDVISLSCQPVHSSYTDNSCLEPVAVNGIARWRPDWRKTVVAGPVVEVSYVQSDFDQRFNNVVFSVKRERTEFLDPRVRLAQSGIDPSGQSYSAARLKSYRLRLRQQATGLNR